MARPADSTPLDLVTAQMVMANDPHTALEDVACVLRTDIDGRVPALAKDAVSRRLRRSFEDFWTRLAAESPHAVLFDTDCFDTLISWLESMAVARSRALRTVACLAAYRLVDGYVDYGNKLRKQLVSMQRQLATEKRKCGVTTEQSKLRGRSRASARVSTIKALSKKGNELARKVDDMTANNSELIELASKVFDSIFILKYRDVSSEIRTISVTALGSWIMSYPDHFLDDKHTKYIGWLLSDKDPIVRRSTLEVLRRMLRKKNFYQSLQLFLQRFCDRLVEMSRDKDDSVAVSAIRLLTNLTEFDLLDEKSCDFVCDIALKEPQPDIRRAAGEFLISLIDIDDGKEDSQSTMGKRKSRESAHVSEKMSKPSEERMSPVSCETLSVERSCQLIKELLFVILRERGGEHRTDLAVNAVWNVMPALRCWDAFVSILMQDQGSEGNPESMSTTGNSQASGHDESLGEHEKAVLCEMLLASVRESGGYSDPDPKAIVLDEENNLDTPALMFSRCFLPVLPQILVQFQTDVRALRALVQLPMMFRMECFQQESQEKKFQEILTKTLDIMSRHTGSPDLVRSCANTFRALLSDKNPLRTVTLKSLQLGYTSASKELSLQVRADLSKAEPFTVAAALLRVRVLSELIEPASPVYDAVVKVLQYQIEKAPLSNLSDDVTTDAARTGCALIMWSLCKIRSRLTASDGDKSTGESLALDEIRDANQQGGVIVDTLRQVCHSTAFSISARIVCLQALLTTLTLCRGVEKFAARLPETGIMDEKPDGASLDFLHSRPQVDSLVHAVRLCVLSMIEHDQELRDHHVVSSNNRRTTRRKRVALPEAAVRDCFASLVQASCQSVLSGRISHLPLLGLLLKRKKPTSREHPQIQWTAYDLCHKFSQRRQLKESQRVREEVQALRDAARLQTTKERDQIVRELGELIIGTRAPGEPMHRAAKELLNSLMHLVLEAHSEGLKVTKATEILSLVGFSVVTRVTIADAKALMETLEEVVSFTQHEGLSSDSMECSLLFTFRQCLEAAASGKTPEIPKLSKRLSQISGRQASRAPKKRKRGTKDPGTYYSASPVEAGSLRRSNRDRKRIDYARLIRFHQDSSDNENSEDHDSEADHEESRLNEVGRPTTAAEVARNMMEFTNSPRVPKTPPSSFPGELRQKNVRRNARSIGKSSPSQIGRHQHTEAQGISRPEFESKSPKKSCALVAEKTPLEEKANALEGASISDDNSTGATQDGTDDGGSDNDAVKKFVANNKSKEIVSKRNGVDKHISERSARREDRNSSARNAAECTQAGTDETGSNSQPAHNGPSALSVQTEGTPTVHTPRLESQQLVMQSPKQNLSSPNGSRDKRKKIKASSAQIDKENIDGGLQELGTESKVPVIRRKRRRRW